jgi:hypothetical protein
MTAGQATRSAARTRRAPAAQSGFQSQMCLGQHQGGVPIFGKRSGQRAVNPPSPKRPEDDDWSVTSVSHQFMDP